MTIMSEDVPPQVIKETQTLLGKYIREPPLSDKLLKKPPFRFLQDIVKSVVKETGFLGDVYTPEELSENIKEKDKKVAFLKKLISATQDATGKALGVRPSKIVAGLEVAKTLELLQSVATGVALKQSGVHPPISEEKKENKKSKDSSGQKDGLKKSTRDDKVEDSAKERPKKRKENGVEKKEKKEVNGDKKRDKVKEAGEVKKRDKSAKEEVGEKKKREKSGKDGEDKDRKKSAKNGDEKERRKSAKEGEEKERRKSAKEEGEEKKREKSGKQNKAKERPPSRRRSLDGLEPEAQESSSTPGTTAAAAATTTTTNTTTAAAAGASHPTVDGDKTGEPESRVSEIAASSTTLPIPSNVLEESKENTEHTAIGSRKSSLDASKDKADKENREKREKRDRSKEAERKTSSRRSSSKVRPSSKNAEKSEKSVKEKPKVEEEPTVLGSGETPVPAPPMERPQTARKPPPSARPQSMRPPSARPGAPKIRDRGEVKTDIVEPENEVKVVPVIADLDQPQDDENTVTVERQGLSPDFDQGPHFLDTVNKVGENEGALVAQILETKKELEETGQLIGSDGTRKPVEIEWEGGRKQKKEAWGREINKLREGIQQLTRSTNPLGKLFDFLQEDVDSMQRELKMWKETNTTYTKQLQNERRMTENSLETYRRQLAELDSLIEQETETLKNMKANVLANDRKIYSLLTRTSTD